MTNIGSRTRMPAELPLAPMYTEHPQHGAARLVTNTRKPMQVSTPTAALKHTGLAVAKPGTTLSLEPLQPRRCRQHRCSTPQHPYPDSNPPPAPMMQD